MSTNACMFLLVWFVHTNYPLWVQFTHRFFSNEFLKGLLNFVFTIILKNNI